VTSRSPTTFVALLRGINVGGKNRVPMAQLKSLLASLGHEDVVTYIQSGNVVFRSPVSDARKVGAAIEKRIAEEFEGPASVLIRTPAELRAVAKRNPFLKAGVDASKLHVVFLDRSPKKSAVADLDPERSPPDEFEVRGSEIYLHLPNGAGRSKLTVDYFEKRLDVRGTARNWRTLTKLISLSQR
jgi:uncharacterized protein (DUF1697 family)